MTKPRHRLLLLRPKAQGERFAAQVRERFGNGVAVTLAPLQEIHPLGFSLPEPPPQGVIFTSENSVEACGGNAKLNGLPVWCVGRRTADTAQTYGFKLRGCFPDADTLVAELIRTDLPEPLLLARGTHARGDIAERLRTKGASCDEIIVYDQIDLPLAPAALDGLMQSDRTTVPLFSPRSAALFSAALKAFRPSLHIVALSKAVLAAYTGPSEKSVIATEPTGTAMLSALADLFTDVGRG